MPISYLNFRFRFVNVEGKTTSNFSWNGRADESDGLFLGESQIYFSDIHSTAVFGNHLALTLYPYIALPAEVTEHILPETTTFVLSIAEGMVQEVKSAIDQHISTLRTIHRKKQLSKDDQLDKFRAMQCPVCDSIIDLSFLKETPSVYCKHCESLFDKHGQLARDSKDYKICPKCDYYNRVQYYTEFRAYAYPSEVKMTYREKYFCDTCATRMYEDSIKKNLLFLLGIPWNLRLRFKIKEGRNPLMEELAEANRLAQDGNFDDANELFSILMLHNDNHPGVFMNYGLAYLQIKKPQKAIFYFQKALEACANYEPVFKILETYKSVNWQVHL